MDKKYIEEILYKVQSNKLDVNDALDKLKKLPYEVFLRLFSVRVKQ
jgi:hypothetical protein